MYRKHKKIYYRPGLISLLFIPLLLCYFSKLRLRGLKSNVLEVVWYNQEFWDQYPSIRFDLPKRDILQLELTGDSKDDDIKIRFGEMSIKEILTKKDTVNAVNFHLGDGCNYSALVRILNICLVNGVDFYILSDDGLFMYYYSRSDTHNSNNGPEKRIEPILML